MNSQEFVDTITEVVLNSSIEGMRKRLEHPAGRNPAKEIIEMSAWYNNLKEADRQVVLNIIAKSTRDAVFGFLCVLDGAVAIEDINKGALQLYYSRGGEKVLLNDEHKAPLHELL